MFVRVLGAVGVGTGPADVVSVHGQVSAAVLAQLALAEGRWVSSEALIDAVWDDAPGSARNAIQVAVSKLRKQFGAQLVLSSPHGYAVDPNQVSIDWQQASRLVTDSRRQLDHNEPTAAADSAEAALELFHGEPLLGLTSSSAQAAQRSAADLRTTARELYARALLAGRQPDAAAAAIQPICESDPLNEPAQLIRIEAFAAAGRLAAALAGYHQLRRALAEELGVDPSPVAQAVFARLLAGEDLVATTAGTVNTLAGRPAPVDDHGPLTVGLAPSRATAYQTRAVRNLLPVVGTAVLSGPSGVGKTQVAAGAFADSTHRVRAWVSASSVSSIIAAYADAADAVQPVDSSRPEKERARRFLSWLASTSEPWLVVLDDITDPADLRGWWPPESRSGLVLATTQRRVAELSGEGRQVLDVGLYTAAESLAYLRQRLPAAQPLGPDVELSHLAATLGHHPLALGLAAAVIIDEASSVRQYREQLVTAPLSTSLPSDVRADGYPRSLQAAWQIALDRADQQTGGTASRLLDVLSMLDPAGVPTTVLDAAAVQRHLDARAPVNPAASVRARTVLRVLHQVSLTDHDPSSEPRAIRTHTLTGRLARERATRNQLVAALRVAADTLVETWPEFPTSKNAETLRSNASAVERLDAGIERQALWPTASAGLPPLIALHSRSLMDAEQFSAALPYLQTQRIVCSNRLGAEHLDTIRLHNQIARAQSLSGDPGRARADLTALLAQLKSSLGDDHPGALITAMTLAGIAVEAGSPLVAVQETEAIIPRLEIAFGPDHEVTLSALQDLANAFCEAGNRAGIPVYDDLIQRWIRLVGEDHRQVVILRADRANWLGHLGEAAASQAEFGELVPQLTRVLGPLDPNTLRARNNRAFFLADHAVAAEEFTALLKVRLEVLGPDHSDTLSTRGNLANRRGMLGDAAGAAEDFAAVIADQERALGQENRFALLCRGYQARWLIEAGETALGAEIGAAAVADLERVLGADHPYSLRIRTLLATLGVVLRPDSEPAAAR